MIQLNRNARDGRHVRLENIVLHGLGMHVLATLMLILCGGCFVAGCANQHPPNKAQLTSLANENTSQQTENITDATTSGLEPGDEVAAWEPVHLTGPEAGSKNCPVCTHLDKPVVLAFAKWTKNTEQLAIDLDRLAAENQSSDLKTFLIVTNGDSGTVKKFGESNLLLYLSICTLDPTTRKADLAKYKIDQDLENTIILYRDFVVWSNVTDLPSSKFSSLSDSLSKLLAQPRETAAKATAQKTRSKAEPSAGYAKGEPSVGDANTLAITAESASVTFVGTSGQSSQAGEFKIVSGKLVVPSENPTAISLELIIDMDSTSTDIDLLTKHLKSDEFFDVEKFPTSKFISKRIDRGDQADEFSVVGDLTVHGVTREIAFPAQIVLNKNQIRLDAKMNLHQSEFGMNQTPGEVVDEVPVEIKLTLDRIRQN